MFNFNNKNRNKNVVNKDDSFSKLIEEGTNNDKWGIEDPDYNIPPEIARLSNNTLYNTFSEENVIHDDSTSSSFLIKSDSYNKITQREIDNNTKIESIQESIRALKPYLIKKVKERAHVQVQEIYPTGESGYKSTLTLNDLLSSLHHIVMKIDEDYESKEAIISSIIDLNQNEIKTNDSNKSKNLYTIREMRLHDLRHLEDQFTMHDEPVILIRRHSVLISFNPIRTIIMADKMILIVPDGADSLLYLLHEHMHGMVETYPKDKTNINDDLSYEYISYQAVFSTISALHNQEYLNIESNVKKLLNNFKSNSSITISIQENIRGLKSIITLRLNKITSYRRLLQELLQKEDDLGYMCLSKLKSNPDLYRSYSHNSLLHNRVDIENLIESYLMDYNVLNSKLEYLKEQLDNVEDLVHFKLDTSRNELLIIDASMNILMAAVAIGTFITALFGMNIGNGFETFGYPYLFWSVSITLCIIIVIVLRLIFHHYNVMNLLPSTRFEAFKIK